MRAQVAADIINSAIWRPGMMVRATVFGISEFLPDLDLLQVEIVFDTYDSSEVTPDGQYTVKRMVAPAGVMSTAYMTEDELLHRVLCMVREAQEHEDREFLRVLKDGRWTAPFHPHNDDTNRLWERMEGIGSYATR